MWNVELVVAKRKRRTTRQNDAKMTAWPRGAGGGGGGVVGNGCCFSVDRLAFASGTTP